MVEVYLNLLHLIYRRIRTSKAPRQDNSMMTNLPLPTALAVHTLPLAVDARRARNPLDPDLGTRRV